MENEYDELDLIEREPIIFTNDQVRPRGLAIINNPEEVELTRNIRIFRRDNRRSTRRIIELATELLDLEMQEKRDIKQRHQAERNARYQLARQNRQPDLLNRRRVNRGPLRRPRPHHPHLEGVLAARQRVMQYSNTKESQNAHQLSKVAKTSHTLARKAIFNALLQQDMPEFTYNTYHPQEDIDRLDDSIRSEATTYYSSADFKRRFPTMSKKFIRKRLKSNGRKYVKPDQRPRLPRLEYSDQLLTVVGTSLTAYQEPLNTLMWFDISEFSMRRVQPRLWRFNNGRPPLRRQVRRPSVLYLLAICNREGFVAFQILLRPPDQYRIAVFLTHVLQNANIVNSAVILLDNAQPNIAQRNQQQIARHLLYNVPQQPQFNLIEMAFSKLKSLWHQRPVAATAAREYRYLVSCVRSPERNRDFPGFRREYLRNIIESFRSVEANQQNVRLTADRDDDMDEVYLPDD